MAFMLNLALFTALGVQAKNHALGQDGFVVTERAVDAATAAELAGQIAGEDSAFVGVSREVAAIFGAKDAARVRGRLARGPAHAHKDDYGARAEDVRSLLYVEAAGAAEFVLVDAGTREERLRVAPAAGLAITWDNARYEHRVDARASSERKLLGPVSHSDAARMHERRRLQSDVQNFEGICTPCCMGEPYDGASKGDYDLTNVFRTAECEDPAFSNTCGESAYGQLKCVDCPGVYQGEYVMTTDFDNFRDEVTCSPKTRRRNLRFGAYNVEPETEPPSATPSSMPSAQPSAEPTLSPPDGCCMPEALFGSSGLNISDF